MGKKSKSSTAQSDNRNAVGAGGLAISGNNSRATLSTVNNITDGGSVKAALDAAIKSQTLAMGSTDKTTAGAFAFAGNTQQAAFATVNDALGAVSKAYEGAKGNAEASSQTAQVAIIAAAAVAAGAFFLKR